jgi:hypothetical protein
MHQIAGRLQKLPGIRRRKRASGRGPQSHLTTQDSIAIHQRTRVLAVTVNAIRPGGKQQQVCRVG